MSIGTAVGIGTAIAGVAGATASIYGANKVSNANETAAKTTSDAATKSAQIQADAADRAAQLTSDSAKQTLDYERGQSQLSLNQYNQQQARLQPYRNLGNFALGLPNEAAPAPLQLPALGGSSATTGVPSTASASVPNLPAGDATAWMKVATDPTARAQFVTGVLGTKATPQLVDYYSKVIAGQPGANATEQAGGAQFYTNLINQGVNSGGGGAAPAAAPPSKVALNYQPSTLLSTYRPLSQIAGV